MSSVTPSEERQAIEEKRQAVRLRPAIDHRFVLARGDRTFQGLVCDISAEGAHLEWKDAPIPEVKVGDEITISLISEYESVDRRGTVAWTKQLDSGYHAGIKFVDLSGDSSTLLDLQRVRVDPELALRLPPNLALRRLVLPFAVKDGRALVACANDKDAPTLQAVSRHLQMPIEARLADIETLKAIVSKVYGEGAAAAPRPTRPSDGRPTDPRQQAEEDVVGLCDEIMRAAIMRQASDIHINPSENASNVRLRVDGVLENFRTVPAAAQAGIVSRFKVLGGMDISEKRAPQDGAFRHQVPGTGQRIDIRIATLPTKYGERLTLRLLALQTESLTLERLGMCDRELVTFESAIQKPHGQILITGPTGSGKSTTLYAAIRRLIAHRELNVVTIEDPIEYDIGGVTQVEIDTADKVSFAKALRSVLRHDPDVVMIGEIRDHESADIATKASLTGHLVFSTLHTNSATGVVTRLCDMGVERFLIAATLRLAMAQRLVRRLCPQCRVPRELTEIEARGLGRPEEVGRTVYEPGGCVLCGERGYIGRMGIFELIGFDEDWSSLVASGAEEGELVQMVRQRGSRTMIDDAFDKLFAGVTSVDEVMRTVTVW